MTPNWLRNQNHYKEEKIVMQSKLQWLFGFDYFMCDFALTCHILYTLILENIVIMKSTSDFSNIIQICLKACGPFFILPSNTSGDPLCAASFDWNPSSFFPFFFPAHSALLGSLFWTGRKDDRLFGALSLLRARTEKKKRRLSKKEQFLVFSYMTRA